MHNHSFTHISIFRFIQNFKVPILFNIQMCVNMEIGENRGDLFYPSVSCPNYEYHYNNDLVHFFLFNRIVNFLPWIIFTGYCFG